MVYAMELKVQTAEKTASLAFKSASQHDRIHVLYLMASLFGTELKEMSLQVSKVENHPVNTGIEPLQKVEGNFLSKAIEDVLELQKHSKKLPLLDSNRSEIVSVGERFQQAINKKDPEPDFYKTGIKIDEDGTKRYKCRYVCSCGKKGNHYIPLKTEEVSCHDCDNPLNVSLALGFVNALGIPERDSFGNFYIAQNEEDSN